MMWANRYVGLPFVDHGRDFSGVDCWGLVRLVMLEEKQIELPIYGDTSALDLQIVAKIVQREAFVEPWIPVLPSSLEPFDVAVMYRRHDPIHIGIMVSRQNVLHIEQKISAAIVPLKHASIAFRYPRFFRHRELMSNAAA